MKTYYQCKLQQGTTSRTAWIEGKGAREGLEVELVGEPGLWEVLSVALPGLPESVMRENQRLNRGSLPSVDRTDSQKGAP